MATAVRGEHAGVRILQVWSDRGHLSDATKELPAIFTGEETKEAAWALAGYLVAERYLFRTKGQELGITPKGAKRLDELKRPWLRWAKSNLAFAVACIAAVGTIVAAVANAWVAFSPP